MKNKILGIALLVVVIAAFIYILTPNPAPVTPAAFDGKNSSFLIDGTRVTLTNGVSSIPAAPGSATKTVTRYFGNEATGDLNGDGFPDTAFLVTQDGGGSGLFYYAVVALGGANGYKITNAVLLGDRIAPQTTEIHSNSGEVYVNYAVRKAGEPMSARPSIGTTLILKVTAQGTLEV